MKLTNDPKVLVRQFQKYGGGVIIFNGIVFFSIFGLSFPIFQDFRLLKTILILWIISFSLLFTYYTRRILKVVSLIDKKDEKSMKQVFIYFKKSAFETFILNIAYLVIIYIPAFFIMFFKFGYNNIYYHFYVFFILAFVFLFLGYNSMLVWYKRTYPLGRFKIPVAVQRLRSKIVSIVLPLTLLTSVFILVMFYNIDKSSFRRLISNSIFDSYKYLNLNLNDNNSFVKTLPDVVRRLKAKVFAIDDSNNIIYSNDEKYIQKNIVDIIERGNQPDYLYRNSIKLIKQKQDKKYVYTEGVFDGEKSILLSYLDSNKNIKIIAAIPDINYYKPVYTNIFLLTIGMIIINLIMRYIVNLRLVSISKSIDVAMPAIEKAIAGDLTGDIKLIKSRDIMEDFIRNFIGFRKKIIEYIKMSNELSIKVLSSSEDLAFNGKSIREEAIAQAQNIDDITSIIAKVSNSLTEIAENANEQSASLKDIQNIVANLNESMDKLNSEAQRVIESITNVENSSNEGELYLNETIKSQERISSFLEKILNVVQLISDIAEQVNLLSLNASIEAARAGEHGRGFAVVAEQISRLSDNTEQNVKEISKIINEGNAAMNENYELINKTKVSFTNIMNNIKEASNIINGFIETLSKRIEDFAKINKSILDAANFSINLSTSMGEHSKNVEKVVASIEEISSTASQFASLSETLTNTANELEKMASELKTIIDQFKIE